MARLWDRGEAIDEYVLRFTCGEDYLLDEQLVRYDLEASAAHAQMLRECGFLSAADCEKLHNALAELRESHGRGEWHISLEEEDCHTAIENRLIAMVGDAGRSIHLGRSRNDQVLVALRLWLKESLGNLAEQAQAVASSLEGLAEKHGTLVMPGYTHMQRAMPSSVRLWALGFASEIRDDAQGLLSAKRRADLNPLGSAAGYGVPLLGLDRESTTRQLGFASTHVPVTAVQLSRGKAEANALFEASLLAQDLGRLAADICLFATSEFGFLKLPSQMTTGSSMLPQKRNPDVFELARGRTAEVECCLQEVLAIVSRMPSGYHRDLQLLKKPLFRGMGSVYETAVVMAHGIPMLGFNERRMQDALDSSMLMTEEAYRLVRDDGIPFREAYRIARERMGDKKAP